MSVNTCHEPEKLLGIDDRRQELVLHDTGPAESRKTATDNEDTTQARPRKEDAQDTAFPGCDREHAEILERVADTGAETCEQNWRGR